MSRQLLITIVLIAIVLVVGFVVLMPLFTGPAPLSPVETDTDGLIQEDVRDGIDTTPPQGFAPLPAGDDLIVLAAQNPGTNVYVQGLLLAEDGYVVVHEVAEGGTAGAIIGASGIIIAGQYSGLEFATTGQMIDGANYIAMLHVDNGDGIFNAAQDVPVTDDAENIISMQFNIDSNADPTSPVLF